MATYKPRKLDELNSMYDKSLEAGRSIKQGSQIADASGQDTAPVIEKETAATDVSPSQSVASATYEIDPNSDISDIANDFILRFGTPERVAATTRLQENETIKAKVKPVSSGPAIKTAVATSRPGKKAITEGSSVEQPEPKVRKVTSYRAELMEDYMKVMNDEDDDTPSFFKGRKAKKDKKKKHHKAESEALGEEVQETSAEQADEATETASAETRSDISFAELSDSIVESAFGEESSENAELTPEQTENEAGQEEEPPAEQAEEAAEEQPSAEQPAQEETDEAETEETETEEGEEEESIDIFSSSNYEDIDIVSHSKERKEEPKTKRVAVKRHILAKTLLSLLLVLCVVLAAAVGALKLVIGVDTGLPFAENYYVFTSDKDYNISSIKANDLVIAENFPPEKGNTFAYIDTDSQSFSFAKYSDTIINDVSDVLITAETDDSRIAVFRDDIRGVVIKTIPQVGKFVALACNYYIVIISVLLALALAVIFILALAFKTKYEDEVVIEYSGEEELDLDDSDDDLSLFEEI